MSGHERYSSTFAGLQRLAGRLRGPNGCPWDREQTRASMKRYILEECYELLEAIDEMDDAKLIEETGDVLFHLAFQIQLGVEEGAFTEAQVFRTVIEKLVRRHPHVFGTVEASDPREIEALWHDIKQGEHGKTRASALEGVPIAMPALSSAQALQERAARAGFDWDDVEGAFSKVAEELAELRQAGSPDEVEAELGDVLSSVVSLGRWLGADAEGALRVANTRFRRRFALMERHCEERGVTFDGLDMGEKEALWQEAKALLRDDGSTT
jgi:tetrapyrrole methylase family protein/MazG family protein